MALRQITRASCRHLNRPSLSLLSIYSSHPSTLPAPFLLPTASPSRPVPRHPANINQRRHAVTVVRFPVAPTLGPQFIDEVRVRFPYDDEITAHNPTYIDETGAFVGVFPIDQILRSYDGNKYHLIHISGADKLTDESEGHVVRLFPKSLLLERLEEERRAEREKEEAEGLGSAKRRKKKSGRDITKEIQISWGIDPHDLETQLKKLGKFLEKGNTVDIMIARKKKQAKVPQAKLDQMMETIDEYLYWNGGVEEKKRTGEVGTQLHISVQRPEDWERPTQPRPGTEVEPEVLEPIEEEEWLERGGQEGATISGEEVEAEPATKKKKHVPAWQARGQVTQ